MARNTQLPSNGNFLQSDLRKAIQKVLSRKQEALLGIVGGAMLLGTAPALAQEQAGEELDEVVVTGLRGSMKASMNIKREATGVVDAISAEDIGKFPDTNLAESLQRISGVSIDRVGGEGSRVTSRGFGPGFNLVTLKAAQMPTADVVVVGSGGDGEYGTFTSRSFDIRTWLPKASPASRSSRPGARRRRPAASARRSTSRRCVRSTAGNKARSAPRQCSTPASRLATRSRRKYPVCRAGPMTARTSACRCSAATRSATAPSVGAANQDWNVERLRAFLNPSNGRVRADNPATTTVNEATIIQEHASRQSAGRAYPNNSDYWFSEIERERINGQLTLQFRPVDSLTLTIDGLLFAQNKTRKCVPPRATGSTVRSRTSTSTRRRRGGHVGVPAGITELAEGHRLGPAAACDEGRVGVDRLERRWDISDRFGLEFDAHTSEAKSDPNGPNGLTSYDFGTGAASIAAHSLDLTSGFPVQRYTYTTTTTCNTTTRGLQNNNGIIDIA